MNWREALAASGLLDQLARFDVRVAGTFPLDLALAGSDIDLLCHARDPGEVSGCLWAQHRWRPGFAMYQWRREPCPLIAAFMVEGVPVEVFAAPVPVAQQAGWLHFEVEQRLLALGGDSLRGAVMALRAQGAKTEPAFARVLGLSGDPYAAMLALAAHDDVDLRALLDRAGFA